MLLTIIFNIKTCHKQHVYTLFGPLSCFLFHTFYFVFILCLQCNWTLRIDHCIYSGTSLMRSPTGLDKSDLNGEVTILQGAKLHCGIQYGTEQG